MAIATATRNAVDVTFSLYELGDCIGLPQNNGQISVIYITTLPMF